MAEDVESLSEEHKHLIRKVCEKVGSNILLFQRIESLLRVIAPNLSTDGTVEFRVPESVEKWQQQFCSKETLGQLVEKVKIGFPPDGSEFYAYLDEVRNKRNQLVHRFHEIPDSEMHTLAQCRSLLIYLDRQQRFALPLLKFATDIKVGVEDVLESSIHSELNWFGTVRPDASQNRESLHP